MHARALDDARLPVWCALSDLFLDTALDTADHRRIADVCRAHGLDATAALRELVDVVLPAFYTNLFAVAGEWAPWPPEDVRRFVHRARPGPLGAPARAIARRMLRNDWAAVARYLD